MGKVTTIYTKIRVPKFIIFELWNSKDKEFKKKVIKEDTLSAGK